VYFPLCNLLGLDGNAVKILIGIFVVILNYIAASFLASNIDPISRKPIREIFMPFFQIYKMFLHSHLLVLE